MPATQKEFYPSRCCEPGRGGAGSCDNESITRIHNPIRHIQFLPVVNSPSYIFLENTKRNISPYLLFFVVCLSVEIPPALRPSKSRLAFVSVKAVYDDFV